MELKRLVSNLWLLLSLRAYHYRKTIEHLYYITNRQEHMKHKLRVVVHTLTVFVNIVKDGVTVISKHPMMLSFKLFLCLLLDLVTISSLSLVVTSLLLTLTQTSEIRRCEAKDSSQHHSRKIKLGKSLTLSHPSRCQMLKKFQSTGLLLTLPRRETSQTQLNYSYMDIP